MQLHLPVLLTTLAALATAQRGEIDFAGDVPPQCWNDQNCANAINPAANCPRNLNVRWSMDQTYLNCLLSNPNFCPNLGACYQCVSQWKREGDIKRMWQICNTPGYGPGSFGFGPGFF